MKLPPLDVPLLPLVTDVTQAGPPGALPARPATLPGHSPFGPSSVQQWTTTTYAYPAAYPRTFPRSTTKDTHSDVPAKPAATSQRLSKEELENVRNAYLERRIEAMWTPTTSTGNAKGPNTLWCTANKYTPVNGPSKRKGGEEPVTSTLR